MSRRNVFCREAHTPLAPSKNRIRRDWISSVNRNKDVITISHGALDTLMTLRWKGLIVISDIDPAVIEAAEHAKDQYPDLSISTLCVRVQKVVPLYCEAAKGAKRLAAVDVDLALTVEPGVKILTPVLKTLVEYRASNTKVLFTFRNGRDSFGLDALARRVEWLRNRLPRGVQYVDHYPYVSSQITREGAGTKGASMCLVELRIQRTPIA